MNQATSLHGKSIPAPTISRGRHSRRINSQANAGLWRLATRPDYAAVRLLLVAVGGLGFSALTFGLVGMLPGPGILYAGALAAAASFIVLALAFEGRSAPAAAAHVSIAATAFALSLTASAGSITAALMLIGAWTLAFGIRQPDDADDHGLTPLMVASGTYLLATGTIGLVAVV